MHEAYLRLVDRTKVDWKGKKHFLAVAAEMVWRILVDHVRKRDAAKRDGAKCTITLQDAIAASETPHEVDLIPHFPDGLIVTA